MVISRTGLDILKLSCKRPSNIFVEMAKKMKINHDFIFRLKVSLLTPSDRVFQRQRCSENNDESENANVKYN